MYKSAYFVWRDYQSRVEFMKKDFGFKIYYLPTGNTKIIKIIKYIINLFLMFNILRKNKYEIIWLQLPPSFLMIVPILFKNIFNKNCVIIADCHNGIFSKKWFYIPFTKKLLNKCDIILIHNEDILNHAISLGVDGKKVLILEDKPNIEVIVDNEEKPVDRSEKIVLFPASFNSDEPINLLLDVCGKMKDFQFFITGNYQNKIDQQKVPKNVKLTGWLSKEEYINLLKKCDVLLGLTLYDGIQLSVANEGVSFEKPMVLSSTNTLRKLFYKGVVFTENDADSLKSSIIYAYQNAAKLKDEIRKLKIERKKRWDTQAKVVKQFIEKELQANKDI